ncbi:MAG: sialate O-acetylesterase [Cyclobacteriaceae bacterium]|nr:sialate O-acetylesterase [Cyclobacteriaceae bacterium]UYN85741.1 MAG: sialate O-acetylesterase [Cyclobacteriaceae bacterium]
MNRSTYFVLFIVLHSFVLSAQVKLPRIISDGAILQRDTELKIWGWASAGEKIELTFRTKKFRTQADASGNWIIKLPKQPAGGPFDMTFKGKNEITVKNILFGDVWFCSGQSNMVHQMNIHDVTYAKDIAEANYPEIRQFLVPARNNLQGPETDLPGGSWQEAVGENVRPFSAVAFFFARKIYAKYKVPIGLINASIGGTPIEAWTSEEGLKDFTEIIKTIQQNKDTAYVNTVNRTAAAAANRPKQETDLGLLANPKWYDVTYQPKSWRNINIPGYWEDQGLKDLNGVVWYRKEIDVPVSMTGKMAKIFLGRIVDSDVLYINGKQVGNTTYQYPQRRYTVPADVLKPGKNIFVIRVTNQAGKGGFVPDKPYCLFTDKDTIDLKGYWQYKVGDVFAPRPPSPPSIAAQNQPTALYNAMVSPIIQYAVKGILWYQGESNAGRPEEYAKLLPALITDWRDKWKQPNTPFIYAQLPGFMEYNYLPSESNWAKLRESQRKALSVPNTAMTVNIDLGEWNDIHPDNKKDVGERMALAALKIAYRENIVHSGPIYKEATIEGNQITISFNHIGSGLITNDGETLREFAIAGADKKFVWANAKIDGDKIIIWSDSISNPAYVHYAWADNPDVNLYNKEGLPASPFSTEK